MENKTRKREKKEEEGRRKKEKEGNGWGTAQWPGTKLTQELKNAQSRRSAAIKRIFSVGKGVKKLSK